MRSAPSLLVLLSLAACTPSRSAHEPVRPFAKVDIAHSLRRAVERIPNAHLGARSGYLKVLGEGWARNLHHTEFLVEVTLPELQTEPFLRELCRQLGIEVRARAPRFDAGFLRDARGNQARTPRTDGHAAGRCDYYAERDGFVGWLGVPGAARNGETLQLRIIEVES